MAHTTIVIAAMPNATGEPASRVTVLAKASNARETGCLTANAGLDVSGTVSRRSDDEPCAAFSRMAASMGRCFYRASSISRADARAGARAQHNRHRSLDE